jgi:hypothetical protein
VIVVADHAHTLVESTISLVAHFTGRFDIRLPTDLREPGSAEVALCPNSRAAMVYVLEPRLTGDVVEHCRRLDGVEHVIWREGEEVVVARDGAELRLTSGAALRDPRGGSWSVRGDLSVLDARVWDALSCPTSGEVLLSAQDGVEFTDWGGASHIRGGSHGSLGAGDSFAPLICCGVEGGLEREQWSIKDVAPLVRAHFGQ